MRIWAFMFMLESLLSKRMQQSLSSNKSLYFWVLTDCWIKEEVIWAIRFIPRHHCIQPGSFFYVWRSTAQGHLVWEKPESASRMGTIVSSQLMTTDEDLISHVDLFQCGFVSTKFINVKVQNNRMILIPGVRLMGLECSSYHSPYIGPWTVFKFVQDW